MVTLKMMTWSILGQDEFTPRPNCFGWRIGTPDFKNALFPSRARIVELFEQKLPGRGGLVVVSGGGENNNYVIVEIPTGIKRQLRESFLRALEEETQGP